VVGEFSFYAHPLARDYTKVKEPARPLPPEDTAHDQFVTLIKISKCR
jgi:hypothetical protein